MDTELTNYKSTILNSIGSVIVSLLYFIFAYTFRYLLSRITSINITGPGSEGTAPSLEINFKEE